MPEEHNRKLTDHLSDVLLAHSQSAVENLATEGLTRNVHLVGNTMIDTLAAHVEAARGRRPWEQLGLEPRRYGIVTLHRPALVDDDVLLEETVHALGELATHHPLVFPVHPRTRERLNGAPPSGLILTPPLGYLEFLGLEADAAFALTDSGGVQEETSALGVRCFTLRSTTERPVTVELGTNTLLGLEPARIREIPALLGESRPPHEIPLWDGHAAVRVADVLTAFLASADA
jgi:UDP-N-acetylglucosamine 2-epimerase (non-hydrolysing)